MKARAWTLAIAFAVSASTAGCSQEKSGPTDPGPPPAVIVLTPSEPSVVANGTNTVTIQVTDTGGATVSVSTNRGTFSPSGLTSVSVAGGTGTVTLRTCNASTAGCAGTATVTASTTGRTASTTIIFGSLAAVCATNCSADATCVGQTCNLFAGGSGTCSSGTPSNCTAAPSCVASPVGASTETSCTDGVDNDCSGGTDCADSSCDTKPCLGGATFFCKSGRCTDVSSGLAVTVTPLRTRLPAVAGVTTVVEVEVTSDAEAASSMAVSIAAAPIGTIAPRPR